MHDNLTAADNREPTFASYPAGPKQTVLDDGGRPSTVASAAHEAVSHSISTAWRRMDRTARGHVQQHQSTGKFLVRYLFGRGEHLVLQ